MICICVGGGGGKAFWWVKYVWGSGEMRRGDDIITIAMSPDSDLDSNLSSLPLITV